MNTYSSYKESGVEWIGEIPSSWDTIKCGYLFRVVSLKNNIGEQNLSVYRDYGVIQRDSRDDNHNRVSEDISNYKLVDVGNFVFNKMKCWMGSLGVSKFRGIVSPSYTVCETTQPFDGKYLHHLLRSKLYIQEFERLSYGVRVGQWELRFHDFRDILSVFPPIQEQQQISNYLDHKTQQIDSLIKKTQQKIELLKEQRTSLINQVVTKGLNPDVEMKDSGVEWIGKIPSGWDVVSIKRLCYVKRGSSPRPIDDPKYFDEQGEFRWVRISDVSSSERYLEKTTQVLSELGSSLSTKRYPGDIFLSIAGSVGKPIISKIKCCIHDGFVWFDDLNIDSEYLYYIFSLGQCFQGLGKFGTQLNLNTETVGSIKITLMTHFEQQQIVDHLDKETSKIDSTIEKETQRIELLKEYRQSLISEVVTGKVDIRDEVVV
jgi:type I restriction enzyme, S subunit